MSLGIKAKWYSTLYRPVNELTRSHKRHEASMTHKRCEASMTYKRREASMAAKGLLSLSLLLAALLPAPLSAAEMVSELILAHGHPQVTGFDPVAVMSANFKKNIETRSNGAILVHIFPDGQLGQDGKLPDLTAKSIIQTAILDVDQLSEQIPLLGLFQIPFAFENRLAVNTLLDGPLGQDLSRRIEEQSGLTVLGFGDSGSMAVIGTVSRPVQSIADFSALDFGITPGHSITGSVLRAAGAKTTSLSEREASAALAHHRLNADLLPLHTIINRNLGRVLTNITLTNHLSWPTLWVMNRDCFNSLSASNQAMVKQAARDAILRARQDSDLWEKSDRTLPQLRQTVKVQELSPSQRQKLQASLQPAAIHALEESLSPADRDWIKALCALSGGKTQDRGSLGGFCPPKTQSGGTASRTLPLFNALK